jgi:hypothetical protein
MDRGEVEDEDDSEEEGNEVELEFVSRQTRRSHMVAPPTVHVNEEVRTLIQAYGDR